MAQSKRHLHYFYVFFVLYELIIYLSNDMIMPGMLQVTRGFHAQPSDVGLSLSLYILGGSSLQIFLGPLVDRFGKRRIMLGGNVLFLLATVLVLCSHSMGQFLLARGLQGMGSCFIFIGYALIHELFDDAEAVKLTTLLSNTAIFAPLIGPVVGSAIVSHLPWQSVFFVSLAVGITTLIGLSRTMPTGHVAVALDLAAIRASYGRIFRCKPFMFGIFIAGLAITPLTAWIGLSPAIVLGHMHQSYGSYIAYQCLIFSGFILSTIWVRRLGDDFSLSRLIQRGALVAVVGISGLGLAYQQHALFIGGMFIYSIGFGLFNGALVRMAMTATGESMSLTASAMSLLYCLYIALGLEVYNLVGAAHGFSLDGYAYCNIPLGVAVFLGLSLFNKQRDAHQLLLAPSS